MTNYYTRVELVDIIVYYVSMKEYKLSLTSEVLVTQISGYEQSII